MPKGYGFKVRAGQREVISGTSGDAEYKELSNALAAKRETLIQELARALKISYKPENRDFWMTLTYGLLDLFPAGQIRWETRGRGRNSRMTAKDARRVRDASPKQRKQVVGEIAERCGLKDETVARQARRRR